MHSIKDNDALLRNLTFTKDQKTLKEQSKNPNMNIRRSVARNPNTPYLILNELAFDPVLNVSYMATVNASYRGNRKIEKGEYQKCVLCFEPEFNKTCESCKKSKLMMIS